MAPNEKTANIIIIKLAEMGHTNEEITGFIGFIETHTPSEEEVKEAIKKAAQN